MILCRDAEVRSLEQTFDKLAKKFNTKENMERIVLAKVSSVVVVVTVNMTAQGRDNTTMIVAVVMMVTVAVLDL